MEELFAIQNAPHKTPEPVAGSDALRALYAMAASAARAPANILIRGEPGVGKKTLARWIHLRSARANEALYSVRCVRPAMLLTEAFFGRPGTVRDGAVPGLLERASGGTLFLDEVCALPMSEQAKLLRVIETGETCRLGEAELLPANVRFIAGTSFDLEGMLEQSTFRADLHQRLAGITLTIPPLRERPDDLEALARHYLSRRAPNAPPLSRDAMELLRGCPWWGNIPQLRLALERACIRCEGPEITSEHFDVEALRRDRPAAPARIEPTPSDLTPSELEERDRIIRALAQGIATEAVRNLGLSRESLLQKIAQYGLSGISRPR